MNVERVIVGNLEENCYIISKENHVLIVDPGSEFYKIKNIVGNRLVDGILITHHHFDHVGALEDAINFYNTKVYDYNNLKETKEKVGLFEFKVIYNPGHTKDSISFYFDKENIMFVGDFIFKNSIGRCDLEGGSFTNMTESLNKIKNYPNNTILYPGHGDNTVLQDEIINNPFFKQLN